MRLIRRLGEIERIFGWHAQEVVGKRVEEFRPIYEDEEARAAFSGNRNYRKDGSVTADLELANENLRLVPFRLIEVRENERKRLAGELHDRIGQTLAALKFRMKHVIATLKKRQSKQAPQLLHELILSCAQNPPAPFRGNPTGAPKPHPPFLKGGRGDFEAASTILNATWHNSHSTAFHR
jgi:signal transduction histidine kinase